MAILNGQFQGSLMLFELFGISSLKLSKTKQKKSSNCLVTGSCRIVTRTDPRAIGHWSRESNAQHAPVEPGHTWTIRQGRSRGRRGLVWSAAIITFQTSTFNVKRTENTPCRPDFFSLSLFFLSLSFSLNPEWTRDHPRAPVFTGTKSKYQHTTTSYTPTTHRLMMADRLVASCQSRVIMSSTNNDDILHVTHI